MKKKKIKIPKKIPLMVGKEIPGRSGKGGIYVTTFEYVGKDDPRHKKALKEFLLMSGVDPNDL
jgi:hypothetical protein